jgi:ketosteroid isomerase-like protein
LGQVVDGPAGVPDRILLAAEVVLALGHESGRARETSGQFRVPFAHVFTVCEGRVASVRGHVDPATIGAAFEPAA